MPEPKHNLKRNLIVIKRANVWALFFVKKKNKEKQNKRITL